MEKNEKIEITQASIDKDVLDIMKNDDVLTAISDDKQVKRLILNCFCEFLSEIKGLKKEIDEFNQMISICSAEKIANFFKELQTNVKNEEKRIELQEKMSKSHKKSKKSDKNTSEKHLKVVK